jgi:hypothetical protein
VNSPAAVMNYANYIKRVGSVIAEVNSRKTDSQNVVASCPPGENGHPDIEDVSSRPVFHHVGRIRANDSALGHRMT